MKILLLNPPAASGVKMVREGRCMQREGAWTAIWAPISLATIAAVLGKEGFEVEMRDCIVEEIDFPALGKIVASFEPHLVIVNTATPSIESDLSVASLVKKINPKIKTVAFGIHVTALPDESFRLEENLDFIIRGEPEITARELTKSLKEGKDVKKVKGISYRVKGKIIHNPNRPFLADLDSLPFPAWQHIEVRNYRMPVSGEPFLLVSAGRGCPYDCLFCADKAYYGQGLRLPSARRVVDELENDQKRFGVKSFLFWSESFTLNRNFVISVCDEIIKRGLKVRFVVNSRVDHVDKNLLLKLKKAGCWQIGYGVESASNRILKAMKKRVKVSQIKKAVELSQKASLLVTGHFMLGFPGETKKEVLKTIKLACGLPFDFAQFYCTVPFPGSDLYSLAKKRGWLKVTRWSFFEQNFSVLDLPGLSARQVMDLRQFAYRKFYLRPKIILGILSRVRSPRYFSKAMLAFWDWVGPARY